MAYQTNVNVSSINLSLSIILSLFHYFHYFHLVWKVQVIHVFIVTLNRKTSKPIPIFKIEATEFYVKMLETQEDLEVGCDCCCYRG